MAINSSSYMIRIIEMSVESHKESKGHASFINLRSKNTRNTDTFNEACCLMIRNLSRHVIKDSNELFRKVLEIKNHDQAPQTCVKE